MATADAGTDAEAKARLDQIKHIVVLMMENRSFDQLFGHLSLDGMSDVDGLSGNEVNTADGVDYPVHPFGPDETVFHPDIDPTGKVFDPCHGTGCVATQIAGGKMSGFVQNFLDTRHSAGVEVPEQYRGLVMGYYEAEHVPVYDHLARNFCVCDAWHAAVPGDTWPNRLYALSGGEAESIGHKPGLMTKLMALLRGVPLIKGLANAPIFEVEAFTRHLGDGQWRWYSHDPATLRAADKLYRSLERRGNFAYFNRKRISLLTETLEAPITTRDSFLDDAAKGELRQVSWIDPNFIDLRVLDPVSNDDHPPSDIRAGQELVLEVYEALVNSPAWNDTLLVIVYDEHGGFFDHVAPPPPPVGDGSGYDCLGVRVPALLVGPRVGKFVCHEVLDHTSLIATILRRFPANADEAIAAMPRRVQLAPHLGFALEDQPRTDIADHGHLREQLDRWRVEAREARRGQAAQPSPAADGAGHPMPLHDFQEDFLRFTLAMREKGLPPGQP